MPTLFFADLVRELCEAGGTGALMPNGAVPGHRRFTDAVPVDTPFHYAIAGVAWPDQWETGRGRIDAEGRLQRDSVAASSAANGFVDFAPGLKTIALTVGADWFAASDAAAVAADAALAGKQPLSTSHDAVATGEAGDLVTVRRATGWVNLPLAALAYLSDAGRHELAGPLGAQAGTAAAPSLSFSADPDTGLFRPSSDALGFAVGGAEKARVDASGRLLLGTTTAPADLVVGGVSGGANRAIQIGSSGLIRLRLETSGASGTGTIAVTNGAGAGNIVFRVGDAGEHLRITSAGTVQPGANAAQDLGASGMRWFTTFTNIVSAASSNLVLRTDAGEWRVSAVTGTFYPGTDNAFNIGAAANRPGQIYAITGTINTCDAREKLWHGAPDAAERRAGRRIAAELGFFQWLTQIEAKGAEAARYHFGVRAQAVWSIMADEGLIAPVAPGEPPDSRYAFLCYDRWGEESDAEGTSVRAAGDRFGIRPDQLALFLIAAQEARLAALEAGA